MKLPWWLPIILAVLVATRIGLAETTPNAVAEMLVSDRAEVVAEGERLLAAEKDLLFDRLLKDVASGDAKTSGRAAAELGILVSPWLRGKEASDRFVEYTKIPSPRRPVERVPNYPKAAAIREALQSGIVKLMRQPPTSNEMEVKFALEALAETLGELANDATVDWAQEQFANGGDIRLHRIAPLGTLVISYMGMPPVQFNSGVCGNSTAEELAKAREQEKKRVADIGISLQKVWRKVQPMTPEDRIRFSIERWRDHFLLTKRNGSGGFFFVARIFEMAESLVRFGEPAVAVLRAQQQVETELEAKGLWETIITTISGTEDPSLVKSLLEGKEGQRELAYEIIAVAKSKAWLKELEQFQARRGPDGVRVGMAIAICYGIKGLPTLELAPESNESLILELQARRDGKLLPGLRRFPFQ